MKFLNRAKRRIILSSTRFKKWAIAYISVVMSRRSATTVDAINAAEAAWTGGHYSRALRVLDWYDDTASISKRRARTFFSPKGQVKALAQTLLLNQANRGSFGHPFHLVNPSDLPQLFCLGVFFVFHMLITVLRERGAGVGFFMHQFFLFYAVAILISWILETAREEQGGAHTIEVQKGFRIAIVLFIASEFMLFVAFFWAFFHFSLNPSDVHGHSFVPQGVAPFFYWRVPMVNTFILLSSGISLTLAHKLLNKRDREFRVQKWLSFLASNVFYGRYSQFDFAILRVRDTLHKQKKPKVINLGDTFRFGCVIRHSSDNKMIRAAGYALTHSRRRRWFTKKMRKGRSPFKWVLDTVLRGVTFLAFQVYEFASSLFNITDSAYGSVFYAITGLHGFHVFIGILFLAGFLLFAGNQTGTRTLLVGRKRLRRFSNPYVNHSYSYQFQWWGHRVAFDGAVWYWHFVDVVWLFVFIWVYWWGFPEMFCAWAYYRGIVPGDFFGGIL